MKRDYGFTFWDGLQLLFLGLKLRGDIDWSWFAVLSPMFLIALFSKIGNE